MYRRSILLVILISPFSAVACPDLGRYLSEPESNWLSISEELEPLFDQCLSSSQYFALAGAAQLNTGHLSEAIESLERALLLDPNNGSAMVDYAQALLEDGQLFAAIEANRLAMSRADAPLWLLDQLSERQRDWAALTRQTNYQIDLVGGYDDNLSGGPDEDRIALTLAGEPILFALNQNLRAIGGPFLNMRGLVRHQRLLPGLQHAFVGQLAARFSDDTQSDVFQLGTQYSRVHSSRQANLLLGAGINHLAFGGNSLFTGVDARYRYELNRGSSCTPFSAGAIQRQTWHGQKMLNGFESKLGLGGDCTLGGRPNQRIWLEGSLLYNAEREGNRLGGDRAGWQFRAIWRMALAGALISAQLDHTVLEDRRGYSQLLSNNTRRRTSRNSLLVQYRRRLSGFNGGADFMINFYHQDQNSNLSLFSTRDTSLDFGISWSF